MTASQAAVDPGTGQAAIAPEIASAHARLLTDSSIQFNLAPYQQPPPPPWLRPLIAALDAIGPYIAYVFWTVVGLGALFILFLIIREATGMAWRWPWQRTAIEDSAEAALAPDEAVARILLAEAEALAASGDYDGAVHLILRRSVEDIGDRLPDFVRPSLTARDIAASPTLPDRARTAFATIAVVVESALFARVPVGIEGWRRARDAYADFALRGTWSAEQARA
ncbi:MULTISPECIES: hypothetical protein [Sphingomonas]|uniref:hypothetical protein n=1 Tax=Sphingomonas TaxID=13687 RepID=UPI00082D1A28|nr:hypothetical protein [Sphingomonas sp. CCH10-B3]